MLETTKSKKIQSYINNHPKQLVKDQTMFISYGGKAHPHKLYRIPIDEYLFHNIRNGRFRAELLEKEEQLKRKLDSTKKEDTEIIRKLLLEQNATETSALMADIQNNGQLEPGIITFDGAVINANRRMAIMSSLYKQTREDKYKYLIVGILPPGVDEVDLWKIEAGLQFGRDFRLQYGGVNELLKLREGEKQGLKPKDISVALNGRFTEKQVEEKLETLSLIDSYLSFINKNSEYHRITEAQDLEKFNSLQKSVIAPLRKKHGKKRKEIAELTTIAFALIHKTDVTHWDIRNLKAISTNTKANNELSQPFGGKMPNTSSQLKLNEDKLKEAYTSAKEVIENEKEKDKPERLLKRAQSALEEVDLKSKKLKDPSMTTLIGELKKRIEILLKASKS
jgi:hypothetical protein